MKRYTRALVAGVLGALIIFGGFAIEWNLGADTCNGAVMQEGDRCVDPMSDGSYDYDDIGARKAEAQLVGGLAGLGLGGTFLVGALVSAASAARESARRRAEATAAAAAGEWPRPEDPGMQERHTSFTSGAGVTVFTHALRYVDEDRVERWASWSEIDDVRTDNSGDARGRVRFTFHLFGGSGRNFSISGCPDDPDFLRPIKHAVTQAKLQHVLDLLEREGEVMVASGTGLRLTGHGFTHEVQGSDRELPWSKITGLVPGDDRLISITHAAGTWDSFHAVSGTNPAVLDVARRLWARAYRGQRI
ncbi:hypothetical protein [Streptomyces subrutilus]|uniref:hypothetical protein n=1 Tax=Streptomyces subrutilus TaxID=36818 RepID=UPI0033FA0509